MVLEKIPSMAPGNRNMRYIGKKEVGVGPLFISFRYKRVVCIPGDQDSDLQRKWPWSWH